MLPYNLNVDNYLAPSIFNVDPNPYTRSYLYIDPAHPLGDVVRQKHMLVTLISSMNLRFVQASLLGGHAKCPRGSILR